MTLQSIKLKIKLPKLLLRSKTICRSTKDESMIPPESLSRLFFALEVRGLEMFHLFATLDSLIIKFIEVVIVVGPLSIAFMILLLKKIEKNDPDRIRWK